MVLNDFQRGKLPYYMKPPGCDENEEKVKKSKKPKTSNDEGAKIADIENGQDTVEEISETIVDEKNETK